MSSTKEYFSVYWHDNFNVWLQFAYYTLISFYVVSYFHSALNFSICFYCLQFTIFCLFFSIHICEIIFFDHVTLIIFDLLCWLFRVLDLWTCGCWIVQNLFWRFKNHNSMYYMVFVVFNTFQPIHSLASYQCILLYSIFIKRTFKRGHNHLNKTWNDVNIFISSPVSWDCRIHWLHLCWGVRHSPHKKEN